MNLRSVALAAIALLAPGFISAQQTTKFTASKANEYGLVYNLPLTAFEVTLAAEKTVSTPGEFYQYARKYLNTEAIITPATSWRIVGAAVRPIAVASESERYLVTLKGGNGAYLMLDDRGFPLSVNDDTYEPEVKLAPLPEAVEPEPTILELPVARQAVTPEMIQSKSQAKRAQLAADKIYELRSNRSEIIAGQADAMPSDGAAMKLALDQLSAQEEALTAMFVGTEQRSVQVRTFTVMLPDDGALSREVVARLSALDGLVDASDLSGDPIYVSVNPVTRGELPVDDKGQPKAFPKGGFAYRIPGTARVTVAFDGKTLAQDTFDVSQLGVVFGLDPALFTSKKAPSYLHLNPLTGAVREIGTLEP